ncbi:MAG: hypothetical protein K2X82_30740 [Gemmataceae bacterium]|nr:hypothetical protein [Gemmataceae bacterium]
MFRPVVFGFVLAAAFGSAADARAVEVTVGRGVAVVEVTPAEARQLFEAVDSAAAFADLIAPALPPEYAAAVKLAGVGWQVVRAVAPDGVPLRVVITAVPPAVLVLPRTGLTAAEVVAAYERLAARPREVVDRLDAAGRELAGKLWDAIPADRFRDWRTRPTRWAARPGK